MKKPRRKTPSPRRKSKSMRSLLFLEAHFSCPSLKLLLWRSFHRRRNNLKRRIKNQRTTVSSLQAPILCLPSQHKECHCLEVRPVCLIPPRRWSPGACFNLLPKIQRLSSLLKAKTRVKGRACLINLLVARCFRMSSPKKVFFQSPFQMSSQRARRLSLNKKQLETHSWARSISSRTTLL